MILHDSSWPWEYVGHDSITRFHDSCCFRRQQESWNLVESCFASITEKKVPGQRSVTVFNINPFQGPEEPVPPTPIQLTVFQLTDAKVICQPTLGGYEAPVDPSNFLLPWATGHGGPRQEAQAHGRHARR